MIDHQRNFYHNLKLRIRFKWTVFNYNLIILSSQSDGYENSLKTNFVKEPFVSLHFIYSTYSVDCLQQKKTNLHFILS